MAGDSGDTSIGGGLHDFPSTSWTLIRAARGAGWREPLQRLIALYWKPAYYYIRAAGRRGVEEAKDLTQDFFARMLERRDWERLSPDRGSFRGFLKRALKNFMVDAARREKARKPQDGALVFRFEDCQDSMPEATGDDPEGAFDREWFRTVLHESLGELERRFKGQDGHFEAFRLYCLPEKGDTALGLGAGGGKTYADVARKLGVSETDVRKRLERCRAELRKIVMERIRDYAGDEKEVEAEYARVLKG